MRILIYAKLVFLILITVGCGTHKVLNFYVESAGGEYQNKQFLLLNMRDSSFILGLRNLGGIDTIHGYFEQQRNMVYLKQFYARVSMDKYPCHKDSICIQFFGEGSDLPFVENLSVNLNGKEYITNDLGMVQVEKSMLKSESIFINETMLISAGEFEITMGEVLHRVWVSIKGPYREEAFVFKVKINKLKFESGTVLYPAAKESFLPPKSLPKK